MIYGQWNMEVNAFDIKIDAHQLRLTERDAQRLLQVLWDSGVRPQGREAEMAAVKLHLQDMRRLVFDGTVTDQPGPKR